VEPLDEAVDAAVGAALEVEQRPVQGDPGQPRQRADHQLLDARLGRGGQRDGVPVAAQPAVHPEDVQDLLGHGASLGTRAYVRKVNERGDGQCVRRVCGHR
jgi:hypothetical protein